MNIKTLLTLSLLMASFNAQSAVTACPSGWAKSADGLTCVLETKTTQTPNQVSNNAKPVCISGFTYSSTSMKCEKNTIASQFTANKAYAYMGGLKLGSDPQEEDKCLNFTGTQTVQPANSYQSGGGNCACNSGFEYNNLSDSNASCNYVPKVYIENIIYKNINSVFTTDDTGYGSYIGGDSSCPSGYKVINKVYSVSTSSYSYSCYSDYENIYCNYFPGYSGVVTCAKISGNVYKKTNGNGCFNSNQILVGMEEIHYGIGISVSNYCIDKPLGTNISEIQNIIRTGPQYKPLCPSGFLFTGYNYDVSSSSDWDDLKSICIKSSFFNNPIISFQ
jgi:hypothetical protein